MKGFNQVLVMGNVARTPELRYTDKNQIPYAFLTIASNYSRKNDKGEYENMVDFVPCVAWGKNAETIAKNFHKGSQIFVRGKLRQREREAEDEKGEKKKRYELQMVLSTFQFIGRKDDEPAPVGAVEGELTPEEEQELAFELGDEATGDDVPF